MAKDPPTRVERDGNLQALIVAVIEWKTKEQLRLDSEAKFMKAVLTGRGVTFAGTKSMEKVVSLVQEEIDEFLVFKDPEIPPPPTTPA